MWSYVNLVSMKITHLNPTLTTVSILNFAYPDQIGSTVKSNLVSILNIHINLACLNPSLTYLYPSLTFIFNVSNNQIQSTFISIGAYEGGPSPRSPLLVSPRRGGGFFNFTSIPHAIYTLHCIALYLPKLKD